MLLIILLTGACNSADMNLVAKATAYSTYYQESYMKKCVDLPGTERGPESCGPCSVAVNDAAGRKGVVLYDKDGKRIGERDEIGDVPLANMVYKSGYLPPAEAEELKALIVRLKECP